MSNNSLQNNLFEQEIPVLLKILTGEKNIKIPEGGFSTDRMIRLALMHRVTGLFAQFARKHPEIFTKKQLELLDNRVRQNASLSLMQLHELIRISREFNEANISYACMKGPQLARMLYGKEALKESVDLDIMLVNESELETAHRHLMNLGYGQSNLNDYKSWFAKKIFLLGKREVHYFNAKAGCHVDLHVRAGANTYLTAGRFRKLYTDLHTYDLEGMSVAIMPPEQYLTFLCYHGALHQFGRLGWLMDIRFFIIRMTDQIDFADVVHIARSLGTERSLYLSLILLKDVFGDEVFGYELFGDEMTEKEMFKAAIPGSIVDNRKHDCAIRYMVSASKRIWSRDAAYMSSLRGRMDRLLFLMLLNKGLSAKADLLTGILIRNLSHVLRWLKL